MLEAMESFCRTRLDENSPTIRLNPTKSLASRGQLGRTTPIPGATHWPRSTAAKVIRSPLGLPTSFKFVAPRPRARLLSVVVNQTPCKRQRPMSTVDSPLSDAEEHLGFESEDEAPEAPREMTRSATAKRARRASHDSGASARQSIARIPASRAETTFTQHTSIYDTIAPERLVQARCMDLRGEKLQTISEKVGIKMTTLGRFLGRHSQKHACVSNRQRANIKAAQNRIFPLAKAKLEQEQEIQAAEVTSLITEVVVEEEEEEEEGEEENETEFKTLEQVQSVEQVQSDEESDTSESDFEDEEMTAPSTPESSESLFAPSSSESSKPRHHRQKGMKRYTDDVLITCAKLHFQGRAPSRSAKKREAVCSAIVRAQAITSATLYDLIHCKSRAKMYSRTWFERRVRCLEIGKAQAAQEKANAQAESSRKRRPYSA
ncbi:BZ3500_MvSof-1268-A1-R1_Chr1-3g02512 [Microbotryum saponariae]|uniref:BZ3500_MvSof-1268-A1-R1_Chr1-3g02512 protein n=1 Tax=Microbotryum saponariae TaxID=289078 RepID=A0A2X0KDM9_9BASI|nr:BZ3500_MvSof-1268-A1-R1_Chr1-3g02512 [Microbotryum saponariae]SCZ96445.1 BZ3501_MvSof-1269-A2-R1_Chr1-3g02115 [Microbotryum saponariae]